MICFRVGVIVICPSHICLVYRVKLSELLRDLFSVLCECCIPNKLLTTAPGVINFGLF